MDQWNVYSLKESFAGINLRQYRLVKCPLFFIIYYNKCIKKAGIL